MTEPHANPEDFDLYALGALDGDEKQKFEAHLSACSACRQELAVAQQRTSLLGLAAPAAAPRPQLKSAILQKVKTEGRAATKPAATPPQKKTRWGLRFSFGFALATAALAFATFELAKQDIRRGKQIRQLEEQAAHNAAAMQAMGEVAGAPDTAVITLLQQKDGPPGQAHVLYNARMGLAVYSGQIAPAPADKSYQLWLVPANGSPVDAGLVAANQQNGAIVVHLAPGVAAKAFAVTLEPRGGMPQPTGPKVLVGLATAG